MSIPKTYKIYIIIILSVLVLSLLPGVAFVWAEASSSPTGIDSLIPPAQGGGLPVRSPASPNDTIVQTGTEFRKSISTQSDGSGVEIVPAAAFINTNELGTGTGGNDWYFSITGGYVTNDSGGNTVCLAAPVYVPPGVSMESFTVYIWDTSASDDVYVYFDRTEAYALNYAEMAWVKSSGNVSGVRAFTDPSISDPVVLPGFNYHVAFCLPANSDFNIEILGAQVNYSNTMQVYLPVIQKAEIEYTTLKIQNSTGGTVNFYKILSLDKTSTIVQCTNIPDTEQQTCGTFESGPYHASVDYDLCGTGETSNPINFPPGECIRTVTCSNLATMTCDGVVVTTHSAVLDDNQ